MTLSQTADQLVLNFQAKQINQGKTKEPQMKSLNNWNEIKDSVMEMIHHKTRLPLGFIKPKSMEWDEFNNTVPEFIRWNWYIMGSKYRNNFDVR